MRFTVAIPTYNRERDLTCCLESIVTQSLPPAELMIVDDGDLKPDYIAHWRSRFEQRGVRFNYRKKDHRIVRRGLSESKNLILREAQGEVVFIFDDDVILEEGLLAEFMRVWEANPDPLLIGVGGLVRNSRKKSIVDRLYYAFFGIVGECSWDVNPVGYVVWDEGLDRVERSYYMHGCVSSFRRGDSEKLGFATFSGGRTALEDIDFCLHAKVAGYHFLTVPEPKVTHNQSKVSREAEFKIGFKESMNRRAIYRKYGLKTLGGRLWFAWSSIGWVLRHALILRFSGAAGKVYGFLCPADAEG